MSIVKYSLLTAMQVNIRISVKDKHIIKCRESEKYDYSARSIEALRCMHGWSHTPKRNQYSSQPTERHRDCNALWWVGDDAWRPEAPVNHYIDQLQLIDFRRVISGQNAPSEVVPNVSVRGDRPQHRPAHCVRPPTPEGRSQSRGRLAVTAGRRLPVPLKYCGNRSRDALSSHVTFAADESSTPELSKCTEIFYQKYVSVLAIASLFLSLVNNFWIKFTLAKVTT